MKKLFVLALLSVAFNAMADDQYLYWMVADDATVTSVDGKTTVKLAERYADAPLYAKVKAVSGDTAQYLNFYASPDAGNPYGQVATVDMTFSMPTFAGFIGSAWNPTTTSFIIELYNESTTTAENSWVGQATLAWDDSFITAAGMAAPPSGWGAPSGFTAAPEPTSGLLMLVGLAGLALRRKNKKA